MDATRAQHQPSTPARVTPCSQCGAPTYDDSGLTEEELRRLVLDTEGRVLLQVVRRTDGRVMARDCGHGTVAKRSAGRAPLIVLSVAALLLAAVVGSWLRRPVEVFPDSEAFHDGHDDRLAPPTTPPVVEPAAPAPPVVVEPEAALPRGVSTADVAAKIEAELHQLEAQPRRVDVHLVDVVPTWSARVVQTPRVAELLQEQLTPVRECYADVLTREPQYRGMLQLTLLVDAQGHVTNVAAPSNKAHEQLRDCCERAFKGVSFRSWGAGTVRFRVVFDGVH